MTEIMTLFFALLSLVALAATLAIVVVLVGSGRSVVLEDWRYELEATVRRSGVALAATVATVATLGSLYMSEVAGFRPCLLCWVQRGFMYPLALVLWVALARGWTGVWKAAVPWSLAGAAVSVYHYAEQRLPHLLGSDLCNPDNPCTAIWVWHFGFVSIPFMALTGFALSAGLLWVVRSAARSEQASRSEEVHGPFPR